MKAKHIKKLRKRIGAFDKFLIRESACLFGDFCGNNRLGLVMDNYYVTADSHELALKRFFRKYERMFKRRHDNYTAQPVETTMQWGRMMVKKPKNKFYKILQIMKQFIDKSALVAEIDSIEYETNYEPFTDEVLGKRKVCKDIKDFINTLEVKEVQEEPVSEELEDAARVYCVDARKGYPRVMDETDRYICNAFKAGAKWQKEQMMKDAIECKVDWYDGFLLDYTQEQQDELLEKIGADVGNRVKVIVIKED